MTDGTRPPSSAGSDRLSSLGDRVLGHVLSFLPATEAARAALLSSRWRHVFAAVHTVSLEEPVAPLPDSSDEDDNNDSWSYQRPPSPDPDAPPPFPYTVSNALLGRGRRGRASAPLRALRVAIGNRDVEQRGTRVEQAGSSRAHSTTVDQWVSYAVQHAAPGDLRLDLRLGRALPFCDRAYSLRRPSADEEDDAMSAAARAIRGRRRSRTRSISPSPEPYPRQDADEEEHRSMSAAGNRAETPEIPPRASRRRRRSSSFVSDDDDEPRRSRRRISISSDERSPDSKSSPSPRRWRRSICSKGGSRSSDDHYAGDRAPLSSSRRQWSDITRSPSPLVSSSSDDTVFWPSPRKEAARRPNHSTQKERPRKLNTMPTALFSCADLRSLSLGLCRLDSPAKVDLPSLETLLLSHVYDTGAGRTVERIIAGSPRLVDLTLEACREVVSLYVPSRTRLRRLALRCCHSLATVVLDASELVTFEYRGAVPSSTFLTLHGGSSKVTYCKVDICGKEVSSKEDATRLGQFLQLFASTTKRLHLESARLGSGFDDDDDYFFPALPNLRHLELRGRVPYDADDAAAVIGVVSRMLGHAANLRALSLFFHPEEHDRWAGLSHISEYNEEELLDTHRLKYNGQSVPDVPSATMAPCLRSSVREIYLVHYQGGRAQRALAKFLLRNAPVIHELWCEFAEGDLWTQTELMREIKGWVMNKSANTQFM